MDHLKSHRESEDTKTIFIWSKPPELHLINTQSTELAASLGNHKCVHAHTHTYWIDSVLTLALGPSKPRAISWATVCSRRLLSSACCRRSLISSRVSSSGCTQQHRGEKRSHTDWSTDTQPWHTNASWSESIPYIHIQQMQRSISTNSFKLWFGVSKLDQKQ